MVLETVLDVEVDRAVLVVGIAVSLFLFTRLFEEEFQVTHVVGLILVGIIVGPGVLDVVEPEEIELLATVGLIYLMFLAGLEVDYDKFLQHRTRSVTFGLLSFLFRRRSAPALAITCWTSIPSRRCCSQPSFPHTLLAFEVARKKGILDDEAVVVSVSGIVVTDSLALVVLAIAVATTEGAVDAAFWLQFVVTLALFFAVLWVVVPPLSRWFLKKVNIDQDGYTKFLFLMMLMLTAAFLAEVAGIKDIIGAFIAGLLVGPYVSKSGTLMNRTEFVGPVCTLLSAPRETARRRAGPDGGGGRRDYRTGYSCAHARWQVPRRRSCPVVVQVFVGAAEYNVWTHHGASSRLTGDCHHRCGRRSVRPGTGHGSRSDDPRCCGTESAGRRYRR